jgi:molecular chaperone HscA
MVSKTSKSGVLLATRKALAGDRDLLSPEELASVERAVSDLVAAIEASNNASRLKNALDALDHATHAWAGRRMDRAVQTAIAGKDLSSVAASVEHAAGVEAHLHAHGSGGGNH